MKKNKILSLSNEKIKYLKKLGDKKFRDQEGKFLVENLRIIHDALKGGFKPESLFITEEMLTKDDERKKYIVKNIDECFVITDKLNKFFSFLTTPSGITAVYKKDEREPAFAKSSLLRQDSEGQVCEAKKEIDLGKIIVYLNGINDPGNMGTIFRTALAFDLENIVVDETCVDIYNPKVVSAARDAIFKLNVWYDKDLEIFKKIKKEMKIYATNLRKGVGVESIKDKKFCVVLGNEANGVDEKILKQADGFIKIDMSKKIESLNVGVTAGIIFNKIFNNL